MSQNWKSADTPVSQIHARQAGDEELRKMADRIQARAIQRCGQLLKEIETNSKANLKQYRGADADTSVTRKQAASDAGMSKDQAVTAIRVANIPGLYTTPDYTCPKPASGAGWRREKKGLDISIRTGIPFNYGKTENNLKYRS